MGLSSHNLFAKASHSKVCETAHLMAEQPGNAVFSCVERRKRLVPFQLPKFKSEIMPSMRAVKTADLLDAVLAVSDHDVSCQRHMQLMSEEAH